MELCDVLGVPRPDPTTGVAENDQYCFEKDAITVHEGGKVSTGKIDLYKDGCFILEAKQGSEAGATKLGTARRGSPVWALAMHAAYGQALGYAQTFDDPPPFIIVCDIGYCFDLYATFDGSKNYRDYPTAQRKRIFLRDLAANVDLLFSIFLAPHTLDPAKRTTRVTRTIAAHLAELARELEAQSHAPERVSAFLMRCIFTMFAEDAGLLPERAFTTLLEKEWIPNPARFPDEVAQLWQKMNTGGALIGVGKILHFNGGLFAEQEALPLTRTQLELLHDASRSSWVDVEPAIFGTLLERALDEKERHALGAHFTPRAYVERLVRPTIEEPLRAEWDIVRAHVQQLVTTGKTDAARKKAITALHAFHRRLCRVSVLDPACGTGNFLYVTLDLLKRLESEVFQLLADLGEVRTPFDVAGLTVTPAQFHGLEVKPWAKEIADLVLWIGYLQWLMRVRGDAGHIPEPVLQKYGNIECRDAVLAWDAIEPVLEGDGSPKTRWDGDSTKPSPVTGKLIPDESKQVPILRYTAPRRALWPAAEFIIGNPPYIGSKRMRVALGDGYVEALRRAHEDVPETADLVMYWWNTAASLVRTGATRQFGFITTNSISHSSNRQIVQRHMAADDPLHLSFAIPDHPWVESSNGAAVRVAMTVGAPGPGEGELWTVRAEEEGGDGEVAVEMARQRGTINADLTIGADVSALTPLQANRGLSFMGVTLVGEGFRLTNDDVERLGFDPSDLPPVIRPYVIGKELTQRREGRYVIDFFGLSQPDVQQKYPQLYQWLRDRVWPERAQNKRRGYAEKWWIFGEPRSRMREALRGLTQFFVTLETSKHRVFQSVEPELMPDHTLYAIALDDPFFLGVLSSRVHLTFALAAGSRLGVGNDPRWRNAVCFEPFPFPAASDAQKARIRDLAECLDAHRKAQQRQHPHLTITSMYNVLAKLRSEQPLTPGEKAIHEDGLISLLRQIHDDLDAAVLDAYGWPLNIADGDLLARLTALNAERAAEEGVGMVRWLRPELQAAGETTAVQTELAGAVPVTGEQPRSAATAARPWPKALPERISAVRTYMHNRRQAAGVADVRRAFTRAPAKDVETALDTLASLGLLLRFESAEGKRWRATAA